MSSMSTLARLRPSVRRIVSISHPYTRQLLLTSRVAPACSGNPDLSGHDAADREAHGPLKALHRQAS